jgi:hypothetical protein|tara:strand:- start:221 stop:442 length:222 start_codon:yes stop_codon:yes gene_type:complete
MSEHKKLARLAARVVYAQTHALERREAAALKAAEAKAATLPNHHRKRKKEREKKGDENSSYIIRGLSQKKNIV